MATHETTAGRSAVVTGAARGIGRAIALRLARDGLDITVNDLPAAQAELDGLVEDIEALARRGVAAVGDVGVEADVDGLVRTHVEVHGGLDVMVANAGLAVTAPLLDTTAEQWETTMRVNVGGVFHCYRAAARQMIVQGRGGRLIGAASVAAHRGRGEVLVAAAAGATYIAPYLGRLNDAGRDGIAEVTAMQEVLVATKASTKILVASIRDVPSMVALARRGIDCFTIGPPVAEAFFAEHLTAAAVAAFEDAARETST